MIIGIAGNAGVGKDTCADHLVRNHGFVKVSLADPLKRIARDVFDFSAEQLWGPSEKRNEPDKRYPQGLSGDWGWVCHPCKVAMHGEAHIEEKTLGRIIGSKVPCQVCGEVPAADKWHYIQTPTWLTPRHALQQLGTEWGRACYPNVWVDYALRVANKILFQSGILRSVHYNYNQKDGIYVMNVPEGPKPLGVVIPDVRFQNEVDAIRAAGGKVWRVTRPIARLEGAAGQHQSETELDKINLELFHAFIDNSSTFENLYQSVDFCLGEK